MQIVIKCDGSARCIYSEFVDLRALGQLAIARGSHVEPDSDGKWIADMKPVNGPVLGPFIKRSDALIAEREWLEANWLLNAK